MRPMAVREGPGRVSHRVQRPVPPQVLNAVPPSVKKRGAFPQHHRWWPAAVLDFPFEAGARKFCCFHVTGFPSQSGSKTHSAYRARRRNTFSLSELRTTWRGSVSRARFQSMAGGPELWHVKPRRREVALSLFLAHWPALSAPPQHDAARSRPKISRVALTPPRRARRVHGVGTIKWYPGEDAVVDRRAYEIFGTTATWRRDGAATLAAATARFGDGPTRNGAGGSLRSATMNVDGADDVRAGA